jgi:hypothetical protein
MIQAMMIVIKVICKMDLKPMETFAKEASVVENRKLNQKGRSGARAISICVGVSTQFGKKHPRAG